MSIDEPDFWQERYINDNIPWHTKTITPALVNSVDHSVSKKIAILGCGYSKDSIFLNMKSAFMTNDPNCSNTKSF